MALHPLDNPVWSALSGRQEAFAVVSGRFRRFRRDVGIFIAAEDQAEGFDNLDEALGAGEIAGVVTTQPIAAPAGLEIVEFIGVPQMVARRDIDAAPLPVPITPLSDAHVAAMLELVNLTHPGPFMPRTIELGRYRGIFDGGRLAAMAGGRMRPNGFAEISAVCTHPDYQRRGYATALIAAVARDIVAAGDVPFLHVRGTNAGAIEAYRKLGFETRREMIFTILKRPY